MNSLHFHLISSNYKPRVKINPVKIAECLPRHLRNITSEQICRWKRDFSNPADTQKTNTFARHSQILTSKFGLQKLIIITETVHREHWNCFFFEDICWVCFVVEIFVHIWQQVSQINMDSRPALDTVHQALFLMFHNPMSTDKEKVNTWLGDLQK